MSEQKAKITLKKNFDKPREVTVSNKTIKASPGEIIEIPLPDLGLWLKTGRFDRVEEKPVSDLPLEIPGRQALEKAEISFAVIAGMDKAALTAISGIGDKTAEDILKYLATNGGQD